MLFQVVNSLFEVVTKSPPCLHLPLQCVPHTLLVYLQPHHLGEDTQIIESLRYPILVLESPRILQILPERINNRA